MATLDLAPRRQPAVTDYPPAVPALLAFVAGYVDVTTFLAFNGLFVAQATGSLVVAGSAFDTGEAAFVKVAAIPMFFLAGIATTMVVRAFGDEKAHAFAATLLIEAGIIGAMVAMAVLLPHDQVLAPLFGLAAMGVQSALARLLLAGYGSTNVMTTNLTQLSIDIETALAGYVTGRSDRDALGAAERVGLVLVTFTLGVVVGGIAFNVLGMVGLMLMVATLVAMATWAVAESRRLKRAGKGGHNG
jgi:uncharacterized membrane protein YoaK (UPF0700 family)